MTYKVMYIDECFTECCAITGTLKECQNYVLDGIPDEWRSVWIEKDRCPVSFEPL